jgi:hypothetical protein
VRVTPDTVVQVVEIDFHVGLAIAIGEQGFQLSHGHSIIISVVKCEVADLTRS